MQSIQKENFAHIFWISMYVLRNQKNPDITQKAHTLKYTITKCYSLLQVYKRYAWQFKLVHELYNSYGKKTKLFCNIYIEKDQEKHVINYCKWILSTDSRTEMKEFFFSLMFDCLEKLLGAFFQQMYLCRTIN